MVDFILSKLASSSSRFSTVTSYLSKFEMSNSCDSLLGILRSSGRWSSDPKSIDVQNLLVLLISKETLLLLQSKRETFFLVSVRLIKCLSVIYHRSIREFFDSTFAIVGLFGLRCLLGTDCHALSWDNREPSQGRSSGWFSKNRAAEAKLSENTGAIYSTKL